MNISSLTFKLTSGNLSTNNGHKKDFVPIRLLPPKEPRDKNWLLLFIGAVILGVGIGLILGLVIFY